MFARLLAFSNGDLKANSMTAVTDFYRRQLVLTMQYRCTLLTID